MVGSRQKIAPITTSQSARIDDLLDLSSSPTGYYPIPSPEATIIQTRSGGFTSVNNDLKECREKDQYFEKSRRHNAVGVQPTLQAACNVGVSGQKKLGPFIVEKTLGKGTFGKVYLCTDPRSEMNFNYKYSMEPSGPKYLAVKVIEKANVKTSKERKNVQRELRLLKILRHPNIIEVKEIIEDKDITLIVMEHASGGELHDYITQKKLLGEVEARRIFRQLISAVDYCHESSLVHRDLKPENLLLDADNNVKLIDFGFGNTYSFGSTLSTFCGSPFYAAPEMTQGIEYTGPEVDIWSMGVILYMMLTGNLPFMGANIGELYDAIARGHYAVPDVLNSSVQSLLAGMLQVSPAKRITMSALKKHPWVMEGYSEAVPNYVPERPCVLHVFDEHVMSELSSLGYARNDYVMAFRLPNSKNPVKALYHLHNEWIQRKKLAIANAESGGTTSLQQYRAQEHVSRSMSSSSSISPPSVNGHSAEQQAGYTANTLGVIQSKRRMSSQGVREDEYEGSLSQDNELAKTLQAANRQLPPLSLYYTGGLVRAEVSPNIASIPISNHSNDKDVETCPILVRNGLFGRIRSAFVKNVTLKQVACGLYYALLFNTQKQGHIVLSSDSLQLSESLTDCTFINRIDQTLLLDSKCKLTFRHQTPVNHPNEVMHAAYVGSNKHKDLSQPGLCKALPKPRGDLIEYSIELSLDEKRRGVMIQSKKLAGSSADHKAAFQDLMAVLPRCLLDCLPAYSLEGTGKILDVL
jgi:serine/threonine protein kinase